MQFSAAVIVTTPQKLAFVDVAKGIRMFARMAVPCVAVAENMSFFDADDGKRCAAHTLLPCPHTPASVRQGCMTVDWAPLKRSGPLQHSSACMQFSQELCVCVCVCVCALAHAPRQSVCLHSLCTFAD